MLASSPNAPQPSSAPQVLSHAPTHIKSSSPFSYVHNTPSHIQVDFAYNRNAVCSAPTVHTPFHPMRPPSVMVALHPVGNLHQLRLHAHLFFKGLADNDGPILFLRLGSDPPIIISSSEIAKHFIKTHDLIFASKPLRAARRLMFFNFEDVIFALYGDHWRQMRRICALELLNAKRIESFKGVREEEVAMMIHSIWEESESGRMGVNVRKVISTLTSNIFGE